MKNVKKILALLIALVLALSLTACGVGSVSTVSSTGTLTITEGKADPAASDYANDIDGFIAYLKDCELIAGEATDMSADFIGAVKGKQFCFTLADATVVVELYEYDLNNLSEKAVSNLESVKTAGKLDILGKAINAKINTEGKFVLIYSIDKTGEAFDSYKVDLEKNFTEFLGK